MSGNTRGKLKEHFEGIHRNTDWSIHHVQQALDLVRGRLMYTEDYVNAGGDRDKEEQVLNNNSLYAVLKAMGESLQAFDEIAASIYAGL